MDDVAVLRLEGGKANAMTPELLDQLHYLINGFAASPARAAVLTGYGAYFSAGLALPVLVDLDRPKMAAFIARFGEAMMRVFSCEKPIVAAINGHAIAGGCVLALECDWRVMVDEGARIGLNETQLGISLPSAVLEPLRLAVPSSSLVPIAYEGRLFSPSEAHELGLVDELAPASTLLDRAIAKAQALAAVPTTGVAQVKLGLRRAAIEAVARYGAEESERWLDTWFSPAAQTRLREVVAKLR